MRLVPYSTQSHATTRVKAQTSYAHVSQVPLLSLYGAEMMRAAHSFVVAFTAENDGFFPGALMSVEPGRNLFVGRDGRWLGEYLPAVLRRAPFVLARVEGGDQWVLCLDHDSELLSETEGTPLVDADGSPAPLINVVSGFLADLERNRAATVAACALLQEKGLVVPWPLAVSKDGTETRRFEGLFRVDEAALNSLAGEDLVALRDTGALPLIYAHFQSLGNLQLLGRLAASRADEDARHQAVQQGRWDLDRAFGIGDDDPFQF